MADLKKLSEGMQRFGKWYTSGAPKRTPARRRATGPAKTVRSGYPSQLAFMKDAAKSHKAIATSKNKNAGTYSSYNPLSSTAQNLSVRSSSSKPKAKPKAAPRKRGK